MKFNFDWKFILPLLISLASVFVAIWIWQADLNGKSLSVKIVSRTSLEPSAGRIVPEMEISIDGKKLNNPFIITFEIANEGRKPIPSSDFESPIEIRLESASSFVSPRIAASTPADIGAELTLDLKKIALKPLLLNPQDTVLITTITTGEPPTFSSKARISGISSIPLQDGTVSKQSSITIFLYFSVAISLFIAGGIANIGAWPSKGVWISPFTAFFMQLSISIPAAIIFITALAQVGIDGIVTQVTLGSSLLLLSFLLASIWAKSTEKPNGPISQIDTFSTSANTALTAITSDSKSTTEVTPYATHLPPQRHFSNLTIEGIVNAIEAAPPLQRNIVQQRFIGLNVEWNTLFSAGSVQGDNSVSLTLKPEASSFATIWCKVPLSEYTELGFLPQGSKIRVSGEISQATRFDITLIGVRLHIHKD